MQFAARSGIAGFQCVHLKSVTYCPVSQSNDTVLEENVLNDMVGKKWFSSSTKRTCLERQAVARASSSPLSTVVQMDNDRKIYLSVHEPRTTYFSRLGRVLVCYDPHKNTWHCPCSTPRMPCPHKAIGKWHSNQSHPSLFQGIRSTDQDAALHTDIGPAPEGNSCPTEEKALLRQVKYLLTEKKIPPVLPKNLISPGTDFPRHLIPFETTCHDCKVILSDPILVTKKAKIVMVSGTIEGTAYKV